MIFGIFLHYISRSPSYLHPKPHPHHIIHQKTPCHISTPVLSLSCKNVQKTTYLHNYAIILYYYSMFENICSERMFAISPGVFTFSATAVFSPGRGCVQLTRQLKKLTYPFHPISLRLIPYSTHQSTHQLNCVKFTHNSPKYPKTLRY